MASLKDTRVLHVADEQLSFACYKYAKRLNRALEKAGYRSKVLSNSLKEAPEVIKLFKPDIIHIHYHPDARKLRRSMLSADELGIPWMVTYHEAERTPLERESHIIKSLQRTPYAIFLCERDQEYGLKQNPSLATKSLLLRQPSPYKLKADWLEEKRTWLAEGEWMKPPINVLHCGLIAPETGIEALLDLSAQFPAGWQLTIAGTIPAGYGKYAKFLKEDATQRDLPIEWKISKRELGRRQLVSLLEHSAFAYMPFGHPKDSDYSGATLHSRMIPLCNSGYVRVFTHRGKYSHPEVEMGVEFLADVMDIVPAIERYIQQPQSLLEALNQAYDYSKDYQWPTIAKQMGATYKELLALKQKKLA